jgi:peptidoglycan-associated lipoprotein
MRRVLVLALSTTAVLLAGCPAPKDGNCKSQQDCAGQAGFGKICVSGKCEECGKDADCQAGFTCSAAKKCEPKGESEADKARREAEERRLREEAEAKARVECTTELGCDGAKYCQNSKCVAGVAPSCGDAKGFTVRFDYDKADVQGDAAGTLQRLAACLEKFPARKVTVAGHCDERGTVAYNQALGKRRAEAVKTYLKALKVGDLATVSFGKDDPVCKESTPDCWAQNRRAQFTVER